jgi:thiamine biosynthesis lipoprotein
MKRAAMIAALLLALLPAALAENRAQYLMGTVCEVSADVTTEPAFAEARRIETMLSTWRDDSELARVNRGAKPSAELSALLEKTVVWSGETGGAFNPFMRPLIDAWQTRGEGRVPTDAERVAALALVRASSGRDARSPLGFEEGAFGKGYAIDRMLNALRERGAKHAVVNFGGQIGALSETEVTIADPKHRQHPVVALTLKQGSISTSSGSEKTFEKDSRRFSHIIDPATGEALPPRGSVSVIADSAFDADVLSTALYVMGCERGLAWARAHRVTAIFIDDEFIRLSAPLPGLQVLDAHFKVKD